MYAELKCKSNFSFLRGASDAREYVTRAGELFIPAIAITDINGVYALPRAFEVSKRFKDTKLITGSEITLLDHPPITLLARDRAAWCRSQRRGALGEPCWSGGPTEPDPAAGAAQLHHHAQPRSQA